MLLAARTHSIISKLTKQCHDGGKLFLELFSTHWCFDFNYFISHSLKLDFVMCRRSFPINHSEFCHFTPLKQSRQVMFKSANRDKHLNMYCQTNVRDSEEFKINREVRK